MSNGNNSSGSMILLLVLGGAFCLCLLSSGGALLAYNTNSDFKKWVDGLFKTGDSSDSSDGDTTSSMAGDWVCPEGGYEKKQDDKTGYWWCQHPSKDHLRASMLPSKAISGKTYTPDDLAAMDGSDGQYGPDLGPGWGKEPSQRANITFVAP